MPPRAQIPGRPAGANDFAPGYAYDQSSMYLGASGGGRRPTVNGRALSDDELASLREYFGALGDEDRNRYDTDNKYRYDVLGSTNDERKRARQQAKDQLAEERRQYDQTFGFTQRKYDQDFGEDRRRYDQDFGESARRYDTNTGVDLLKTGATLRGARDFVQGDMFAQGAQGISPWIQSMRTGQSVQYGGGTATTGHPTPLTVSTLASAMSPGGGGTAAPATGVVGQVQPSVATAGVDAYGRPALSAGVQQAVDAGSQVFQKGLANQGLGWLESQSGEQQDALWSIGDYLGRNVRSEKQYYDRSRPGQRSGALA